MSKSMKNKKKAPTLDESPATEKPSESQNSLLQEQVTRLQQEVQEHKNKYLHLLAESENTRKRMLKEKTESNKFAISHVMADFIQPIDHFENALNCADNMSDEIKNWALGFKMILEQLKTSLANQGIKAFDSLGKQFDPYYHEAMETLEDNSQKEGLITKEFVKGYRVEDRVLRPAKVQVIKHSKSSEEKAPEEEQNK